MNVRAYKYRANRRNSPLIGVVSRHVLHCNRLPIAHIIDEWHLISCILVTRPIYLYSSQHIRQFTLTAMHTYEGLSKPQRLALTLTCRMPCNIYDLCCSAVVVWNIFCIFHVWPQQSAGLPNNNDHVQRVIRCAASKL